MSILYTGGTFDLFHVGHVNFLRQCKLLASEVVVALNSDDFVFRFKNQEPIMPYDDRKRILEGCRYVSRVVPNIGGEDSKPTIIQVVPNIIAIGDDWVGKDYYKQMGFTQDWLDQHGIVLVYIPYTKGISSTELRERL